MGVAGSAPQGAHYHADVTYLLPQLEIKKGAWGLWYTRSVPDQHSVYPVGQHTFAFYTTVTTVGLSVS